ncbi:hypothetical protein CYMTET_17802, partial [Cymbomonas tetramitiformis]
LRIGHWGVGFKAGAMALGTDALVFTVSREDSSRSVGFLSRTYNKDKEELMIPIVSWTADGTFNKEVHSQAQAQENFELIETYSCFHGEDFEKEFKEIEKSANKSGTHIYITGLKRIWHKEHRQEEPLLKVAPARRKHLRSPWTRGLQGPLYSTLCAPGIPFMWASEPAAVRWRGVQF